MRTYRISQLTGNGLVHFANMSADNDADALKKAMGKIGATYCAIAVKDGPRKVGVVSDKKK